MYEGFEAIHSPRLPNIMSAPDTPLWKAVRAGVAPCLSNTNLKKVGATVHVGVFEGVRRWGHAAVHVDFEQVCAGVG